MNCDFVRENLVELMNGTLPEGVEMEVRSHLLMCDDCQKEYESLNSVNSLLGMHPEVEPSDSMKDAVLARFHVEQSRSYSAKLKTISKEDSVPVYFTKWIFLQFRRPAVVTAAAAVVVLMSLIGIYTGLNPSAGSPLSRHEMQELPDKYENELDAKRRVSLVTKTAHARIERELDELATLDIPEQPWRITELDPLLTLSKVETPGSGEGDSGNESSGKTVNPDTPDKTDLPEGIDYNPVGAGMASLYENRFSSDKALTYYEGEDIRKLIDGGLKWLLSRQRTDGSWGAPGEKVFITSLSGLCLLSEIGSFTENDYSKPLKDAIDFISSQKTAQGFFGGDDGNGRRAHITALCFLTEYYNLKGASELRDDILRGIKYTYTMGNVKGWEFTDSSFKADTSVTGWYILLLESVQSAGFTVDRKFIDRARSWIVQSTYGGEESVSKNRNFYEDDAVKKSVAFMGRFFLKEKLEKKDIPIIAAQLVAFLSRDSIYPETDINPYFLHFAALGLFQNHGREWHIFNREAKRYIANTAAVAKDPYGNQKGIYWPSAGKRYQKNGDEFYTALNILTLQTYYRFSIIK